MLLASLVCYYTPNKILKSVNRMRAIEHWFVRFTELT